MTSASRLRTFWGQLVLASALALVPHGVSNNAKASEPDETQSWPTDDSAASVDFATQVLPLLSRNCYSCHGPDEEGRQADLRLDDRHAAVVDSRVIEPGSPEDSDAFLRIISNGDDRMPPSDSGHVLSAEEISLIKRWIKQGAAYSPHWSFAAPVQPELPEVRHRQWCNNDIDYFVLHQLESAGLTPTAEADRHTLIRRASLDLTGLPPTIAEVAAFVNDTSPDAYAHLLDRLLNSPAYGERWASVWLDLARYADSRGYGSDPLRENIWPYRDWVIQSLNSNMPFNQFIIKQLAGDLLPEPATDDILASAFNRNTMTNVEGGTDDEEFRVAAVKDRAVTTMEVTMGLTLGCAQCHSHKFDPISHHEFYQLYAFFDQTADRDKDDDSPLYPIPTPFARQLQAKILQIRSQLAAVPSDNTAEERQQLEVELTDLIAELEKVGTTTDTPIMVELQPSERRQTFLMQKGNFLDPGGLVEPRTPEAFHSMPNGTPPNRLGLAQWIMSPANPLTSRVTVNRLWSRLFGIGLVETEEDFGTQGAQPSHPQLLDWLAIEFQKKGWDTKAMLKTIMLSSSYRQSSHVTPALLEVDPQNRLISRGPRVRLDAEMIRDQALAISGLLSDKMYGPSVYPPQPAGLWQAAFNASLKWPTSEGEDRYRRGVYTFLRRTVPYPGLAAFDAPSREQCTLRRMRTNTPIQVFVTLNDPCYVEMSQAYARRVLREGGESDAERMGFALELALCRPATGQELSTMLQLLSREMLHFQDQPNEAAKLETDTLGPLPDGVAAAEVAAWTVVCNVILNLDAVLAKG